MSSKLYREEYLATITHGRLLLAGSEAKGSPLLVGFHGYGENAGHHLESCRRFPEPRRGASALWRPSTRSTPARETWWPVG